jgi:hypothetical protein
MNVVASWTGARADALRQALRMTIEGFAGHLGVATRTAAYWRAQPDMPVRPVTQQILDVALARAPEQARAQFALLLAERERQVPALPSPRLPVSDDVASLTAWITSSNTSDEAIEHIDQAAVVLADRHTQVTARCVLADVLKLHRKMQTLLYTGKQRLRQTRDLIRIDSDLLAQASVLLGDLGLNAAARSYGGAALLGMQEAEISQAKAWYALAKTARWQHNYAEAADLALHGLRTWPGQPDERPARLLRSQRRGSGRGPVPGQDRAGPRRNVRQRPSRPGHGNLALVLPPGTASDLRAVCRAAHWRCRGRVAASGGG